MEPSEVESSSVPPGRSIARERSVASFYADQHADPAAVRVCRGTSCELAGARGVVESYAARGPCRAVYCVGYCDRSPAALLPDGRIALGDPADRATYRGDPAPTPAVRALGREPLVAARIVRGDFSSLAAARRDGAYSVLARAIHRPRDEIIDTLERSGERGRGGAAFSTGAKWRTAARAADPQRVVVANGDEGDPGSFVDRVLLEADPHAVLEGMALCARAIGAREGLVYVRSEYPRARVRIAAAVAEARAAGLLGPSVLGSGEPFEVSVISGRGSYVCGEETALLNALEGRRGEVRLRPPYPAECGYLGRPTVVNNVETLANVPIVLGMGAERYARLGTAACSGTKVLSLNVGFARPGLVEVEFGTSLRDVIEEAGGAELTAVVLGGPMGSVVPADAWDVPICYAAMAERGIQLGHGGLVAVPEDTDFAALLRHGLRFMSAESCGRCAPCALGSRAALALAGGDLDAPTRAELQRLFGVMERASLCAFGQLMPGPLRALLERCGERAPAGKSGA
jgi:NADH:ubiquinone oxidoreductase subunit F (NADH-binding)